MEGVEVGRVSQVGVASEDFRKQVLGYGLTTAHILYRMPDHPSLLQTYVWQNYDLFPKFPALQDFLAFWQEKLHGHRVERTVELLLPEGEEILQRRELRKQIVILPDVGLQQRGMIRHAIEDMCRRQPVRQDLLPK